MQERKMSEKFQETVTVVSQKQIGTGIYDLTIQTKEIAAAAKAGQFVSVYSNDASKLLPRPISLCGIDRKAGTLRLVYRVTGEHTGTEEFSRLQAGDTMKIMGPLGNGFTVEKGRKAFLIGGGIGVPPMLQLAKEMKDAGENFQIVMGYRDAGTFLLDEFKEQGESFVATEDGSVGTKGNVLDAIRENHLDADVIYACGPTPMLRALKAYAEEQNMTCYVSMEERMACGIGACLACVCNSTEKDAHSNVKNKRICKEGPVFNAKEVEL
jgi:dihydroorotate dehydrogenase electron transfer subunit